MVHDDASSAAELTRARPQPERVDLVDHRLDPLRIRPVLRSPVRLEPTRLARSASAARVRGLARRGWRGCSQQRSAVRVGNSELTTQCHSPCRPLLHSLKQVSAYG